MRPEAMSRMAKSASRFRHAFGAYSGDPMPKGLIICGLALSVIALIVGIALGWEGLVSNVSANLIILGPGLLITNILVGAWREEKIAREVEPLAGIIIQLLGTSSSAAIEFIKKVGMSAKGIEAIDYKRSADVAHLIEVRNNLKALAGAIKPDPEKDTPNVPTKIKSSSDLFKVAELTLIEKLIAQFGALRPAPDLLIFATTAAHIYDNRILTSIVEMGSGTLVGESQRGFPSFRRFQVSNGALREDPGLQVYVQPYDYGPFLEDILVNSYIILEKLYGALPSSTIERIGKLNATD